MQNPPKTCTRYLAVCSLLTACGGTLEEQIDSTENALRLSAETEFFVARFMPDNDLDAFDMPTLAAAGRRAVFRRRINEAARLYAPIIASHNARLIVRAYWLSPTVNAYASRFGRRWKVTFHGGLFRRPEITADGFSGVVCHELAHHLGGYPTVGGSWASVEGNADYIATLSCLKLLWEGQDLENEEAANNASQIARDLCEEDSDPNLCARIIAAGQSLAELLAVAGGEPVPSPETPDPTEVDETLPFHPPAQCRLDSYVAGALCSAREFDEYTIPKDEEDLGETSCIGDEVGARPRCWFQGL